MSEQDLLLSQKRVAKFAASEKKRRRAVIEKEKRQRRKKKQKQQTKLATIKELINEYNAEQLRINPEEERQYILDSHIYGCRCQTCWYDYNGKKYSEKEITSVYTDIHQSDSRFYKD